MPRGRSLPGDDQPSRPPARVRPSVGQQPNRPPSHARTVVQDGNAPTKLLTHMPPRSDHLLRGRQRPHHRADAHATALEAAIVDDHPYRPPRAPHHPPGRQAPHHLADANAPALDQPVVVDSTFPQAAGRKRPHLFDHLTCGRRRPTHPPAQAPPTTWTASSPPHADANAPALVAGRR